MKSSASHILPHTVHFPKLFHEILKVRKKRTTKGPLKSCVWDYCHSYMLRTDQIIQMLHESSKRFIVKINRKQKGQKESKPNQVNIKAPPL